MQTLLLIRHGQASFDGPRYDVLSALGREQGRRLGQHLARAHPPIEVLFSGPRARQRDTASAMREAAAELDVSLPEALVLDELDEFPAITLVKRGLPLLYDGDAEVRGWLGDVRLDAHHGDGLATLGAVPHADRVFRRLALAWVRAELPLDDVESFRDFQARVCRVLARIADEADGRRAAVVTSGGPVAMAMQLALDLADEKAMRLCEVVANTGLTTLRRAHDEWIVTTFNALPHLGDRSLITYR